MSSYELFSTLSFENVSFSLLEISYYLMMDFQFKKQKLDICMDLGSVNMKDTAL